VEECTYFWGVNNSSWGINTRSCSVVESTQLVDLTPDRIRKIIKLHNQQHGMIDTLRRRLSRKKI
jgi:hypothetical protein